MQRLSSPLVRCIYLWKLQCKLIPLLKAFAIKHSLWPKAEYSFTPVDSVIATLNPGEIEIEINQIEDQFISVSNIKRG